MVQLLPLPPRAAIAALENRGRRLDPTFSWMDAWQEDHAAMLTVAKSAGFDILDDIYQALLAMLSEGKTFRDFSGRLTPILQAKGWWGRQIVLDPLTGQPTPAQLGSLRRLQLIFDVNMRVSYAAGHWRGFERTKAARPYLRYVCVRDDRTRPEHLARHNLVLPVDHPYWDVWAPPCGWNCRCTLQSLSERDVKRLQDEGETLFFEPPPDTFRNFLNKRTGEIIRVPDGIDPGWGYNPGKAGYREILRAAREKASAGFADNKYPAG
ncbi:MAG: minor capsid protein [Rhizobiaceae bacterium]|nr:minor capsid protein [Rhizobiaceae bacterium]